MEEKYRSDVIDALTAYVMEGRGSFQSLLVLVNSYSPTSEDLQGVVRQFNDMRERWANGDGYSLNEQNIIFTGMLERITRIV